MQLGMFFPGFFRVGAKLCRRVALQDQRSPPSATGAAGVRFDWSRVESKERWLTDHAGGFAAHRSWAHWQISYLVNLSPFTQSAQDHKIEMKWTASADSKTISTPHILIVAPWCVEMIYNIIMFAGLRHSPAQGSTVRDWSTASLYCSFTTNCSADKSKQNPHKTVLKVVK